MRNQTKVKRETEKFQDGEETLEKGSSSTEEEIVKGESVIRNGEFGARLFSSHSILALHTFLIYFTLCSNCRSRYLGTCCRSER